MPKPLISPIIFWSFIGIAIVIIFAASFFTTRQCIDVAGCSSCWSTVTRTAQSPACPENQTCRVEAYVDQHNAVTSALICACNKARTGADYPNQQLNARITEAYSNVYGSSPSVQEVCESGGLVRIGY